MRSNWPRRRAADQSDKIPSPHGSSLARIAPYHSVSGPASCASQQIRLSMSEMGQKRRIGTGRIVGACPLYPGSGPRTVARHWVALSAKDRPVLRKIAATLGVGVGTVQRVSRELAL